MSSDISLEKMMELAAFGCIGLGPLMSICIRGFNLKSENEDGVTCIEDLEGLGEFLAMQPLNPTVALWGAVGSSSTVENNRSGASAVFVEETVTICYERKGEDDNDSIKEYRRNVMLNRKEVPWYLDDGTARVSVREIQYAKGFYATLKKHFFTEPVTEHFERFFSSKDVQFFPPACCEHVLEIGTPLTIVGKAEKDKDGAPMIGRAYQVFNGHIIVDRFVSHLKSKSYCDPECWEGFSWFLVALGMVLVAVRAMPPDTTESKMPD